MVFFIVNHTEKKQHLSQLNENEFRRNVVIPLLNRLSGVSNVTDNHGAQERGIDIVYFFSDPMNTRTCVGIQLKVGDVSAATGRGNDDIVTLEKQISLASKNEVVLVNPVGKFQISKFQIMTTGKISNGAKEHLAKVARDEYRLNLEFKEGEHVIELLDRVFPDYWRYLNKDISGYYSFLKKKYAEIEDVTKLGAKQMPFIEDIYVPVTVTEAMDSDSLDYTEQQPRETDFTEASLSKEEPKILDDVELLTDHHQILLIGESGSGKRVLLRRLLFEQLKRNETSEHGGVIPFLIDARELTTDAMALRNYLDVYLDIHDGKLLKEHLEERIQREGVLILVDKLSRIAAREDVNGVLKKLTDFSDLYPKVRCIVATRETQLIEAAEHVSYKRYKLDYFGSSQVGALVDKWYSSIDKKLELAPDVVVQQLIRNVSQGSLPRTPLVYTLNLILLDNEDSQNSNIADLFDRYVDLFLGKWNDELKIESKFSFRQKKRFLSELAYEMQQREVDCMPTNEVRDFFGGIFEHIGINGNSQEMLEEMKSGGILTEEQGYIRFTLYVLQEFFTGIALREQDDVEAVLGKLDDRFWGQAIVFYAGLKRECNTLLEHFVTLKETDDFAIQGYRSHMAGMIASNADQSENSLKKEAVRYALLGHVLTLRRLAVILRHIYGQVGELYAGNFLDLLAFYSVGSPLLERQYKDLLKEQDGILKTFDEELVRFSDAESVIPQFLLSSMLLRFGADGYLEEIQKLVSQPNPYILWLLYLRLNDFEVRRLERTAGQETDLSKHQVRQIRGIRTKLTSKLRDRKYREANREILQKNKTRTKEAYLLPPPEKVLAQPAKYLETVLPEESD